MSRAEIEARVNVLASDAMQSVDKMMRDNPALSHHNEFIVYVGIDEHNAIRYIAGQYYRRLSADDERFAGCILIGVKLQTYFHVALK